MSPLFGHKDAQAGDGQQGLDLAALVDRLDSLSLAQLAGEVMSTGFGPEGPGADKDGTVTVGGPNINAGATVGDIALAFDPKADRADDQLRRRFYRLIAEGLQTLEHAGLIRVQMHTSMSSFDYALTRRGQKALDGGEVERILGRDSV